jgi:hypothetical protein
VFYIKPPHPATLEKFRRNLEFRVGIKSWWDINNKIYDEKWKIKKWNNEKMEKDEIRLENHE